VDPDASSLFARLNPDKWSVAIDVRKPEGAALVVRLAAWADVVALHGEPGAMDAIGLTPAALRAGRPELVVLTSAAGGATVDPLAARGMALLVAAALFERMRTGSGRHIDASEAGVVARSIAAGDALRSHTAPSGIYPCAGDAWIAIEVADDAEWRALVATMGSPAWAQDARFATAPGREEQRAELDRALAGFTGMHAPYPLMGGLQDAGVPAGVVQDLRQVIRDPQLAHRHHFVVLDHAAIGRMPYERSGFRLAARPAGFDDSAPLLGEDDDVVFGEILGLSADDIERLLADGVIG
jgi:crotonobetainyl-CoA:carnitine CoA-transferase CaiB-like acyl-CoA transferase